MLYNARQFGTQDPLQGVPLALKISIIHRYINFFFLICVETTINYDWCFYVQTYTVLRAIKLITPVISYLCLLQDHERC